MDPEQQPPHGPGEDDDDHPGSPWLPPDDRLWRHPSDVRSNPSAPAQRPNRSAGSWLVGPEARTWLVGVISGVVGALVCGGVLIAAGALLLRLLQVKNPSLRLTAWTAILAGSLAIPLLATALPKVPVAIMRALVRPMSLNGPNPSWRQCSNTRESGC